jgi:HEAT repeat protein
MVREMAAETLGLNVNGALGADQLISSLRDAYWQVRLKAIRSLGRMKIERAVPPIGQCITHEEPNLRKEAAAALGEIAIADGEAYLALVANDPDPDVRKNARWARQQIVAQRARAGW